jgi:very-short-patch-repair endonuclease
MTDAERRLWSVLRQGRLHGCKFRRQQPIGAFVVDFFNAKAGLIVELDGNQHSDEERAWYDYRRTKWLASRGYRVLRFTNHQVLKHTTFVIDVIWEAISPPTLPAFATNRSQRTDSPPSVAPTARQLPPQGGKR